MEKEPDYLPTPEELEALSPEQRAQVMMQLEHHEHEKYLTDIALSETETLQGFVVHPEVYRPDRMVGIQLARHLFKHRELFNGKIAMDMGCGSGLQGVVMGRYGAEKVILTDISPAAVANAQENVDKFQLSDRARVVQSDLFANVGETANVIAFNHPFFPAKPVKEKPVSVSMLNEGDIIHRFLDEAKAHLTKDGVLVMPFLHLAGDVNDPEVQGPKHGYEISTEARYEVNIGLQKGPFSLYHLRPKE